MVKVERLPSGSYRARVLIGDGKYKSFTGKDKKAVQLEAAEFEAGLAAEPKPVDHSANMTVGEAMEKYIIDKSSVLSPATIRSYDSMRRMRLKSLVNVRISDITQEIVQRAINEDAARLSPKSIVDEHGYLASVLEMYSPGLTFHTTMPQRKKSEMKIPTNDEVDALTEYFHGTEMELPFSLAACCGMRESEICGLKWSDIDIGNAKLTISNVKVRNKNGKIIDKQPKTVSGNRTISLNSRVIDIISRTNHTSKYVTILSGKAIYSRFVKACKMLGLQHYRFHDLRHYLVSVMLWLNVPKKYIADYVGHTDEKMIDRVYGHIMADKKTTIDDMMNEYFSKSATKSATKN